MVTTLDKERIERLLLDHFSEGEMPELEAKLNRMVDPATGLIPSDLVTVDSVVTVFDHIDEITYDVKLVYLLSMMRVNQVSVLSPLGTALLGSRAGEVITFRQKNGELRTVTVRAIVFQPEASRTSIQ